MPKLKKWEVEIVPFIPSMITISRILLTPVIAYLWMNYFVLTGAAIFVFAAWTDWLDGITARALKAKSDFGAFIDGMADKIMILSLLWVAENYYHPSLNLWGISTRTAFIAIAVIEVLLVLVRLPRLFNKNINIHAGDAGKSKFLIQLLLVASAIGILGYSPNADLAPIAIVFGLASLVEHIINLFKANKLPPQLN